MIISLDTFSALFPFSCCLGLGVYECSVQIRSVAQSCPTLCDPMNRSTPGLPVHHQLPEFTETHVHRVSDAIQPSHPLSSPFPPAPIPYECCVCLCPAHTSRRPCSFVFQCVFSPLFRLGNFCCYVFEFIDLFPILFFFWANIEVLFQVLCFWL